MVESASFLTLALGRLFSLFAFPFLVCSFLFFALAMLKQEPQTDT
jgi:hypothetical protein